MYTIWPLIDSRQSRKYEFIMHGVYSHFVFRTSCRRVNWWDENTCIKVYMCPGKGLSTVDTTATVELLWKRNDFFSLRQFLQVICNDAFTAVLIVSALFMCDCLWHTSLDGCDLQHVSTDLRISNLTFSKWKRHVIQEEDSNLRTTRYNMHLFPLQCISDFALRDFGKIVDNSGRLLFCYTN